MHFLKSLNSFYNRRLSIPVKKNDLVLDMGSGDKPHWRADVLIDNYIEERYGSQRSGSSNVAITKPLIVSSAEKMPFKDKVFDYIICSHLLEHVQNPDLVIEEIIRVGKSGYIELPFEGMAKIRDFPSHLWYCRKEGNKLIFTAKERIVFDKQIDKLLGNLNIRKDFEAIGSRNFDDYTVQLFWHNHINYQVNGKANMGILREAQRISIRHSSTSHFLRALLISSFSTLLSFRKNSQEIDLLNVLECSKCKGEIIFKKGKFTCSNCRTMIKIVNK